MKKCRDKEPYVPLKKYRCSGAKKSSAVFSSYSVYINHVSQKIEEFYQNFFSILILFLKLVLLFAIKLKLPILHWDCTANWFVVKLQSNSPKCESGITITNS